MFEFIKQGLLGLIYWLNGFINDFGITIIAFTLILKIVLLPVEFLAFLEEEKMKRLRPKMQEILKKYKNDFQKQAQALAEVYAEEKYNPFFTMLIQFLPLPIFLAVFLILKKILTENQNLLFLQTINLAEKNIFIFLAVILFQALTIFNLPKDQRKFALFFFGLIVVVLFQFPALFNLYWLTNLILTLLERGLFRFYYIKFSIESVPKKNS